ncbi:MAG: Rieske 2Fe-2S domain-containing protein [Chloroflexota bacterium]
MLSREDNDVLTRVGPGTVMGTYLRRFWLPFALASELPAPDCPPVRVKLLGEHLVAFRTSAGQLGLLAENCPHRGASLFFGRNEEAGLRCVYHGWKFDSSGACLDMPNEPAESNFKHKVRVTAYPCAERGDILWAYLGPAEHAAQIPELEWMHVPQNQRWVSKRLQRCNYMQSLEGELDSSHVGFLHSRPNPESQPTVDLRNSISEWMMRDKTPHLSTKQTDSGMIIGARRDAEPGSYYWRVTQYLLPTYTMIPPGTDEVIHFTAAIPIDDENMMGFTMTWSPSGPLSERVLAEIASMTGIHMEVDPKSFLPVRNRENDYNIDRNLQRLGRLYTGIKGVREEDHAVQEGMGAIYDRTKEHLGTSDLAVIQARRRLLTAARALQSGEEPYAASHGEAYRVRSASVILPHQVIWEEGAAEALVAQV